MEVAQHEIERVVELQPGVAFHAEDVQHPAARAVALETPVERRALDCRLSDLARVFDDGDGGAGRRICERQHRT